MNRSFNFPRRPTDNLPGAYEKPEVYEDRTFEDPNDTGKVIFNFSGKIEIHYKGEKPSHTLESVAHTYLFNHNMNEETTGKDIKRIPLPEEDITDKLD